MDALEETGLTPADPGFYPAARSCVIDLGIVRRRKVDVAADIPARRIADLPVELDGTAGRSIRAAERDLARRMVSRYETALANRSSGAVVEGIDHDLVRRVARAELKDTTTSTTGENVFSMMRRIGQAKAGLAADYAAQLARSAGKVVFFAKHVDVMDAAEETFARRGIRFSSIRGDQTATARQKHIDAFVNDPDVAIAVCSLTAAGVGLNLQVASNIVLAELSWTDAEQTQAIDRSHRIGQEEPVTAWRIIAAQTIDSQDRRADRQQGGARRPGARRLGRGGVVLGRRAARGAGRVADRRVVGVEYPPLIRRGVASPARDETAPGRAAGLARYRSVAGVLASPARCQASSPKSTPRAFVAQCAPALGQHAAAAAAQLAEDQAAERRERDGAGHDQRALTVAVRSGDRGVGSREVPRGKDVPQPEQRRGRPEHLRGAEVPRQHPPEHGAEGDLLEEHGAGRDDDEPGEQGLRQAQVVAGVLERRPDPGHEHPDQVRRGDHPDRAERPPDAGRRAVPAQPQLRPGQPAEPGAREQRDALRSRAPTTSASAGGRSR